VSRDAPPLRQTSLAALRSTVEVATEICAAVAAGRLQGGREGVLHFVKPYALVNKAAMRRRCVRSVSLRCGPPLR